jgi:hypothetical protein
MEATPQQPVEAALTLHRIRPCQLCGLLVGYRRPKYPCAFCGIDVLCQNCAVLDDPTTVGLPWCGECAAKDSVVKNACIENKSVGAGYFVAAIPGGDIPVAPGNSKCYVCNAEYGFFVWKVRCFDCKRILCDKCSRKVRPAEVPNVVELCPMCADWRNQGMRRVPYYEEGAKGMVSTGKMSNDEKQTALKGRERSNTAVANVRPSLPRPVVPPPVESRSGEASVGLPVPVQVPLAEVSSSHVSPQQRPRSLTAGPMPGVNFQPGAYTASSPPRTQQWPPQAAEVDISPSWSERMAQRMGATPQKGHILGFPHQSAPPQQPVPVSFHSAPPPQPQPNPHQNFWQEDPIPVDQLRATSLEALPGESDEAFAERLSHLLN